VPGASFESRTSRPLQPSVTQAPFHRLRASGLYPDSEIALNFQCSATRSTKTLGIGISYRSLAGGSIRERPAFGLTVVKSVVELLQQATSLVSAWLIRPPNPRTLVRCTSRNRTNCDWRQLWHLGHHVSAARSRSRQAVISFSSPRLILRVPPHVHCANCLRYQWAA
jgi:hypothetical protein